MSGLPSDEEIAGLVPLEIEKDRLASLKADYEKSGEGCSNLRFGYVALSPGQHFNHGILA